MKHPPHSPTLFPYTTLFRSFAAGEIAFLPVTNHLRAAHAAKRAQRGHEINRFENVGFALGVVAQHEVEAQDRKSTRLNSSHSQISYAVFCLKKKKKNAKSCC